MSWYVCMYKGNCETVYMYVRRDEKIFEHEEHWTANRGNTNISVNRRWIRLVNGWRIKRWNRHHIVMSEDEKKRCFVLNVAGLFMCGIYWENLTKIKAHQFIYFRDLNLMKLFQYINNVNVYYQWSLKNSLCSRFFITKSESFVENFEKVESNNTKFYQAICRCFLVL